MHVSDVLKPRGRILVIVPLTVIVTVALFATLAPLPGMTHHLALLPLLPILTLAGFLGGIRSAGLASVLIALLLGPFLESQGRIPALSIFLVSGLASGFLPALIARARGQRDSPKRGTYPSTPDDFLETVLDGATEVAIIASDEEGRITVFNTGAELMLGYAAGEMVGKNTPAIIHDPKEVAAHGSTLSEELGRPVEGFEVFVARARQGGHEEREWTYIRKDGSRLRVSLVVTAIRNASGVIEGFVGVAKDVTQGRAVERALRESEDRFRGAFDNAPIGMALVSPEGAWLRVNRSLCNILGYCDSELLATTFKALTHPDDLELDLSYVASTLAGEIPSYQMEKRYYHKDGHVVHALLSVSLVRGENLEPRYFISQIVDITDRKRYEEQIRASLEEKELLLREIHHRVKNNLQVVCTLLDLQSEHTCDDSARSMFRESQDRVRSMALIHERLYHTEDLTRVDFSDYVERLAEELYHAYRTTEDRIHLEVYVDPGPLPIDIAIPCGLLLNELLSNCLKHAFPPGQSGNIQVRLERDGAFGVLEVADDGAGAPGGLDFSQSATFGLQLVDTLVTQLKAELECREDRGTRVRIKFPTNG